MAQQLIDDVSAKKRATDSLQASFDKVDYCYNAAKSAEQMELSARNPQMTVAGQWKLIRLHTQKRLAKYNEQKATAAAAAAGATNCLAKAAQRRQQFAQEPRRLQRPQPLWRLWRACDIIFY